MMYPRQMTMFVCLAIVQLSLVIHISELEGQASTPKISLTEFTLTDFDQFRERNWKNLDDKTPGAMIDSVYLTGHPGWILCQISRKKVAEKIPRDLRYGFAWDSIESRLIAINRDNGKIMQAALTGVEKGDYEISSNYTMLGENIAGVTVKKRVPVGASYSKVEVQLFGWDLKRNIVSRIDGVKDRYSAMIMGVLDRQTCSVARKGDDFFVVENETKSTIKVNLSKYPPIIRFNYGLQLDTDYLVPGFKQTGIVICNNNMADPQKLKIQRLAFQPKNRWSVNYEQIRTKANVNEKTFFNGIVPVFGLTKDHNVQYYIAEFEEEKRRYSKDKRFSWKVYSISWKIVSVNSQSGRIERVESTEFIDLDIGMPVVSQNGRWLAVAGIGRNKRDRIALVDLKNWKWTSTAPENRYHELVAVTNEGHVICKRGNAVITVFPDSGFSERTNFELWPSKNSPKKSR